MSTINKVITIVPCLLIKLSDFVRVTYIIQPTKEKHTDAMEINRLVSCQFGKNENTVMRIVTKAVNAQLA